MGFDSLFAPVERADELLAGGFAGAPLVVALVLAAILGLRHASDPDHLVAVTSLVASDGAGSRRAAALGAWWGLGHATVLLLIGLPLIALKSELPTWLSSGAEKAVGVVIIALAARLLWRWAHGDYRLGPHRHDGAGALEPGTVHRHLRRPGHRDRDHAHVRSPRQAFGIGLLHGLAGTGAVVLLLIAALPTKLEAAAALAVFAPMSIASMAALTGVFAWVLTRPVVEPLYRRVLIPALGLFGLMFGLWYVGLT